MGLMNVEGPLEVGGGYGSTGATIAANGNISTDGTIVGADLLSGQWTPTLVNVANCASFANAVGYYARVGAKVVWELYVEVTTTAGSSTLTQARVPLPVASNFTSSRHVVGQGNSRITGEAMTAAYARADTTNDEIEITFLAQSAGVHVVRIGGMYTIL